MFFFSFIRIYLFFIFLTSWFFSPLLVFSLLVTRYSVTKNDPKNNDFENAIFAIFLKRLNNDCRQKTEMFSFFGFCKNKPRKNIC